MGVIGSCGLRCVVTLPIQAIYMQSLGITEAGGSVLLPVTKPWRGIPSSWRDSLLEVVDAAT